VNWKSTEVAFLFAKWKVDIHILDNVSGSKDAGNINDFINLCLHQVYANYYNCVKSIMLKGMSLSEKPVMSFLRHQLAFILYFSNLVLKIQYYTIWEWFFQDMGIIAIC
jgi:hypothetical protein